MPQGVGYGMDSQIDGDPFPNLVRDRDQLSTLWTHIAQVLSDGVRQKAMEETAGGPAGLPPVSEWAGADGRLESEMLDDSGYQFSDGPVNVFTPEGMPTRQTNAPEFRVGDNQIAQFALGAGFTPEQAAIAVAIALAESGGSTAAVGDVNLRTNKWGSSLGLWQIRSLNRPESGNATDRMRDYQRLFDPQFNAQAAYAISGSGNNWNPWTVYKTGAYRQYLGRAERAVQDAMSSTSGGR